MYFYEVNCNICDRVIIIYSVFHCFLDCIYVIWWSGVNRIVFQKVAQLTFGLMICYCYVVLAYLNYCHLELHLFCVRNTIKPYISVDMNNLFYRITLLGFITTHLQGAWQDKSQLPMVQVYLLIWPLYYRSDEHSPNSLSWNISNELPALVA